MEMNPILYKVAAAKDMAYAIKCKNAKAPACLGPMHGIPVILKDNVAADHMQNTAGRGHSWRFVRLDLIHLRFFSCPYFRLLLQ